MNQEAEKLLSAIKKHGFICHSEPIEGTADDLIVCSEVNAEGIRCGISFCVYKTDLHWEIALWSGRRYQVETNIDILSLIFDVLSGEYVEKGKTPTLLPNELLHKYGIKGVNC